jgi:hypothetical protein
MRTTWTRRGLLTGMGLLFLLSFGLPAVGEWGRPDGDRMHGLGALLGALLLLSHPSLDEGRDLFLVALSAQSNLFFVWGWLSLAVRPTRLGGCGDALLMAWGLFSLVLALMPLFCWGAKELLVGYYLWVLVIGLLTAWLCWLGARRHEAAPGAAVAEGPREGRVLSA